MDQAYWKESFTKRWFLRDQETLPQDAVQQVQKRVNELQQDAATWIRRLHADHWHTLCSYPLLPDADGTCVACKTIFDVEQLLLQRVYVQVSGVVLDFFHEPDHKDQLEEAIKLYAWAIFHWRKRSELVRGRNELLEYSQHRVERLYSESYAYKVVGDEGDEEVQAGSTTREDLGPLILAFAKTYSELVHEFDAWRRENPGVIISAFPAV